MRTIQKSFLSLIFSLLGTRQMESNLNICVKVDDGVIYQFMGQIDNGKMVDTANFIEQLLVQKSLNKDKIKKVFEVFIETLQNILSYSYQMTEEKTINCHFALGYYTQTDEYVFESCNLIHKNQKPRIEQKLASIRGLSHAELRKLLRQKSRTAEDRHDAGAGIGYIMMARKSSKPIEVKFLPHEDENDVLLYKQRVYI